MIKSSPKHSALFLGSDMLSLFLTFLISVFIVNENKPGESEWILFIGFVVLWFLIGHKNKLYGIDMDSGFNNRAINYVRAYVILVVLVYIFYSLFPTFLPAKNVVLATILGLPVLGIPTNYLLINFIDKFKGVTQETKYTLVAGVGRTAGNFEKLLYKGNNAGRQIKGFIKCKNEECFIRKDKIVGDLNDIDTYLRDNQVDELVIALPVKHSKKIKNIIAAADYHGVRVKYIPDFQGLFGDNYKITNEGKIVAVNVRQLPLDETNAFYLKNTFDKVFAASALIFLSPLFLLIALLIKLDSPGPVFYCPIRIGKAGRPFKIIKFRSMHQNDSAVGGTLSTQKNDPRITRIGRILRKYSLDELPQFINVVIGNMSVVGPRPHRSYLNQQLQASVDKYMIRHYFKPGITGWAQVNGWRGPTETFEQKSQRTYHDIWYMENWSFMLDIKIIFKTVFSKKAHKSAF
jgi:Undecaprenyl-phosphate glucose phosphotransferase